MNYGKLCWVSWAIGITCFERKTRPSFSLKILGRVFQTYSWSSLLVKEHGHNF